MSITRDEVRRIASLANLEFGDQEQERFTRQLGAILDYVAQLDRLDTRDVEPMSHVGQGAPALREDALRSGLDRDAALANAPETDRWLFKVPRVIG